jgi:hypothetical protein
MGFILSILASVLKWILQPIAFVIGCLVTICIGQFNHYNTQLAISKDRYGNVLCQHLFNMIFINLKGYRFGNGKETISSVIGKNKRDKTLSLIGRLFDSILDFFEKEHSIKSIDETIK